MNNIQSVIDELNAVTSSVLDAAQASDLNHRFNYHAPSDGKRSLHEGLRALMKFMASYVLVACPPGREQALALTKIEEAMMWANAAIARS